MLLCCALFPLEINKVFWVVFGLTVHDIAPECVRSQTKFLQLHCDGLWEFKILFVFSFTYSFKILSKSKAMNYTDHKDKQTYQSY